jgi:signal transduction histidine kinase
LTELQADFLRGMTHDLQTPLTSIGAIAGELEARTDLDPAARGDVKTIEIQADRLRRMVGQLLAVGKMDAGVLVARQEVFRIDPIVHRTWQALQAGERMLELDTERCLIVADADRVEQILWALLDNAIKYSADKTHISVRLKKQARSRADDNSPNGPSGELVAELSVTDEGFGMDRESVEHAFEQFYRSDSARVAAPNGSGIGLYAARGLASLMGGSMSIDSRPGLGTTVRLLLPAEPDEMDNAARE